MKKWEKEILQKQIKDEAYVTTQIELVYKKALDEINDKILILQAKEQTQSVIYQLKYQQALYDQIESVYSKMAGTWYQTIDEYLKNCYEDSFFSTMYSLHQEGIPVVIPFDQKAVAQATAQDIGVLGDKLSQKLYDNTYKTAKETVEQISKGIAMNSSYATIALNIAKSGTATMNNALRITRTEAHRIQEEVKYQTIDKVKNEKNADIVKQWDATIDKRTRPSHTALDGQLREIEQPFKSPITGYTAMYPGGFGIAKEDINCRCVCLQRARWALDKSELDKYVGDLDGMTDEQLEELANKFGVTKDELVKKSNGVIESDGSINHTIKAQNYNQFKKKYQTKVKLTDEQIKAQEEAQKIADLQNAVGDAQNKLNGIPNKTYSGIWKDDVSLSDYEFKKDAIQKKKDYYLQQLATGNLTETQKNQYLKYLDDLDEFEIEGSKYLAAKTELNDLQKQLKTLTPSTSSSPFSSDAYGQRYQDALKRRFKIGDDQSADKYYRPQLDAQWDNIPDNGKYATWEYTRNSNPMNKPISGYANGSWDRRDFVGVGNVDWGTEDSWRSIPSNFAQYGKNGHATYKKAITDLTKAIDETDFADDVILCRGSDNNGFAGLLENSNLSFDTAKRLLDSGDITTLKSLIEGEIYQSHAFMSTAMTQVPPAFRSTVYYEVYAPKGTHALYAEPQSYYGSTIHGAQLYTKGMAHSSIGSEAEIILQRGTSFRVTSIEMVSSPYSGNSNTYTIKMEVVDQPDYFKYGDEETFNNGATRHSK